MAILHLCRPSKAKSKSHCMANMMSLGREMTIFVANVNVCMALAKVESLPVATHLAANLQA